MSEADPTNDEQNNEGVTQLEWLEANLRGKGGELIGIVDVLHIQLQQLNAAYEKSLAVAQVGVRAEVEPLHEASVAAAALYVSVIQMIDADNADGNNMLPEVAVGLLQDAIGSLEMTLYKVTGHELPVERSSYDLPGRVDDIMQDDDVVNRDARLCRLYENGTQEFMIGGLVQTHDDRSGRTD